MLALGVQYAVVPDVVGAVGIAVAIAPPSRIHHLAAYVHQMQRQWNLHPGIEQFGRIVRRDAFPLPKDIGDTIITTLGQTPASALTKTIELTDGPNEMVVAEVWRVAQEASGAIVKRNVHVILKKASEELAAVAAALA